MAVTITKPAFNIRDKLAEIGANVATSQMPSGTIINTGYSEYDTQVIVTSAGERKYSTIWTPHINATESGSDFLVMAHIQGYWMASANGVNMGIQRWVDDAWITTSDEPRSADSINDDQWMGAGHSWNITNGSFHISRFAMDTYRNYKAGQKVMYDIGTGFWATGGGEIRINYSGYSSQCVAFIMEIKQ